MTNKDIFIELGTAYVNSYLRETLVYKFLHDLGITMYDDNEPESRAIENVLEGLNSESVELLLLLCDDGYASIEVGDKNITCTTVQQLADVLFD